jgi:hypothetical protein
MACLFEPDGTNSADLAPCFFDFGPLSHPALQKSITTIRTEETIKWQCLPATS